MQDENSLLSEEHLRQIEQRLSASTPGPWISFIEGRDHTSGSSFIRTAADDIELSGATAADQDFIANARQDIPAMLEEIKRLRERLERVMRK